MQKLNFIMTIVYLVYLYSFLLLLTYLRRYNLKWVSYRQNTVE